MKEQEDFPVFDEFGNIVEEIQKEQEGVTYKQPPRVKGVVEIPPPDEIQYKGSGWSEIGRVGERLIKAGKGEKLDEEPASGYSAIEEFAAAIISGTIKIPKGFISLTAEIKDALGEDDIPVNEGFAAKFEKAFQESIIGRIGTEAEKIAYDGAVGRLTDNFLQLYGGGKAGAAVAVKVVEKAKGIVDKVFKAKKSGKLVTPSPNGVRAANKAKEMNKITGKQKFAAVAIGGGAGIGLVADATDIGTFGDWLGGPTRLDDVEQFTSQDDAVRKLTNRFKLGLEGTVINVPFAYGINYIANRLASQGRALANSNKKFDRWINKYIREPFIPAGKKSQELFQAIEQVKGKIAAGQITARDLIRDIDQSLAIIAKESGISTKNPALKRIVGRLDELLTSSDDVVVGTGQKQRLVFKGFNSKAINDFKQFTKEVGLNAQQTDTLFNQIVKVRNEFNQLKNEILRGRNLNVGSAEFNQIMGDRMRNMFSSEYKIFTDKSIIPMYNYKPSQSAINEVKDILQRYARANGKKFTPEELDIQIEDILSNVRMNTSTLTPEFQLTKLSVLDDVATQNINIADNFVGGKFKANELIKTEKDLRAFNRFFGQKRDLRNTIINTMHDLSALAARDKFYSNIAKLSESLQKEGKQAIVYNTRNEALANYRYQPVVSGKNGLQIKSALGESVYTNPLNGKFTSEPFADALQFQEKILFDNLAKSVAWQHLVLIPKGLTQISKTILGPFTHTRNFLTSAQFAVGTGNLFKNPVTIVKNFRQAFNTIQPQMLYRNLPKDQALFKFLTEEQVVSSSPGARDITGLLDDIGKGGDVYNRFFGRFGKAMKTLYQKAQDLYLAEDDIWKVFNFLGEFDSYKNIYTKAFQAGKIKVMPSDLEIMKKAASIVRNTVPNYGYVADIVKASRRLPTGNFVSWPYEIIRTGGNIVRQGIRELDDPLTYALGMKRLVGFGTMAATTPAIVGGILQGLYGITDPMISAIRRFLPDYAKDSSIWAYRDENGDILYINASGALVYDTLANPVQAIIANVEQGKEFGNQDKLLPYLGKGIISAASRLVRPFVEESIYLNVVNNLLVRDGLTKEGYRLWNTEDDDIDKILAALKYAFNEVAPLSKKQFERLVDAYFDQPGPRGEKYELDREMAGFYGLRGVKVDPLQKMDFKINEFKTGIRLTRSLLTGDITKGGEISRDDIIQRYIKANRRRHIVMQRLYNDVKAAEILEVPVSALAEEFEKRQEGKVFDFIKADLFSPLKLTESVQEEVYRQRKELESEFDKLKFEAPLDKLTYKKLGELEAIMSRIPLSGRFEDYINPEDFIIEKKSLFGDRSELQTPPLPEQPMPNPSVVQAPAQMNMMQNGLTPTESALLSQEEQMIRLKQRGLA